MVSTSCDRKICATHNETANPLPTLALAVLELTVREILYTLFFLNIVFIPFRSFLYCAVMFANPTHLTQFSRPFHLPVLKLITAVYHIWVCYSYTPDNALGAEGPKIILRCTRHPHTDKLLL